MGSMTPDMDAEFVLTKINDGDSCRGILSVLLVDGFDGWTLYGVREDRVRLINLDTPERGEPGWNAARNDLTAWFNAHPKPRVRTYGREGFGRILGDIYDPATGETATQYMMIEKGWEPYVSK